MTYPRGSPDQFSDEFVDDGERYYGAWEYPFGGNIDDRGADQEFLDRATRITIQGAPSLFSILSR